MCVDAGETCSGSQIGMTICFSFEYLWKVEEIFLDNDKIVITLNTFLIVVSFFDSEGSVYDSMDGVVRILGGQGVDAWFAIEVGAFLDEEGLGKMQ